MQIYCFCSAETNESMFNKSIDFLKQRQGPIKFCTANETIKNISSKKVFKSKLESIDNYLLNQLDESQIQIIREIELYRGLNTIPEESHVVYCISRTDLNYSIDLYPIAGTKNTCINLPDSLFTEDKFYLILAYELLVSAFAGVLRDNGEKAIQDKLSHEIGCMSHQSTRYKELAVKVRSGFICNTCLDKLYKLNYNSTVINHILTIMEKIREAFNRIEPRLSRVVVNRYREIQFPDYCLNINLTPAAKTLFIFFLNHTEGCSLKELSNYREELKEIYSKVSCFSDPDELGKGVNQLIKNSLNENISRIKSELSKLLTLPVAEKYFIKKINNIHIIDLDRSLVELKMVI